MARILTIGKRRYLAGMIWRSLAERPDKQDLRDEAEKLGADWYALRPVSEEIIQAGFCPTSENLKAPPRKLISLAATAAAIQQEPWLGIFEIADNLYWYIAVRDGHTILPNGDIIGTQADVDEAWAEHAGYNDWNQVNGNLNDLIALLDKAKALKSKYSKPVYIKPLYAPPLSPALIGGTLAVLGLIAGGAYWWHDLNQQKEHAIAAQLAATRQAAAEALLMKKKTPVVLPPAVLSQAMPDEWLAACQKAIGPTPLSVYGWDLASITCAGTNATLEWKRSEIATVQHRPDGGLSPDGNTVTGSLPIEIPSAGPDNRQPMKESRVLFQSWAQARGFDTRLSEAVTPRPATLPGQQNTDVAPLPPPEAQFSLTLAYPPASMQFDSLPGVRLTSMRFDGEKWNLAGTLYGK